MEELIGKIAEILDVEDVDVTKKFSDYDEWDSLCLLSILALLDSDYHKTMKASEIMNFASIEDFCKEVIS